MFEKRDRERIPLNLRGQGSVVGAAAPPFRLEVLDFSVLGLKMRVEGPSPAVGEPVELRIDVSDIMPERGHVTVAGTVVRDAQREDGAYIGVRLDNEGHREEMEAFDHYYITRFFDMEL